VSLLLRVSRCHHPLDGGREAKGGINSTWAGRLSGVLRIRFFGRVERQRKMAATHFHASEEIFRSRNLIYSSGVTGGRVPLLARSVHHRNDPKRPNMEIKYNIAPYWILAF